MYELVFDKEAIDFLNKVEKQLKERIFNKLIETKENPFHFFELLECKDEFKLRVGDYRVIADIDASLRRIQILVIGHRKNIYKNL